MVVAFALGDLVTLRKQHPCGGRQWRVERVGADIGIRCLTCGHYVLVSRQTLEHGLKQHRPAAGHGEAI